MQSVSNGDNLHEMPNLVLWEKWKDIIHLSSANFSQRVVKVKETMLRYGISINFESLIIKRLKMCKCCLFYGPRNRVKTYASPSTHNNKFYGLPFKRKISIPLP